MSLISNSEPPIDSNTDLNQASNNDESASDFSSPQFDIDQKFPEFTGWESIGFHRGLGREFWQLILEMFSLVVSIFILSFLMPILAPFPEIRGYQTIAGGVFAIIYMVFDMGTNFGLGRFIAEFRLKSIDKMLQYVSFTIWWQSFSGLIQVTILSWFAFQVIVNSEFSYLTWILLIGLQKQFPGYLGIFRQVLEGLQHYDKVEIIAFLQSKIVEQLTVIGFVLYFRHYGEMNPQYGLLMGIIIGTVIGNYVDDVAFEFMSAYYLHQILQKYYGLSIKDAFKRGYDRDVLKNIFYYSAQGSALPLIATVVNTYIFFTMVANINGYATWTALIATGMSFAGQIRQFGDMSLQNSIAEAFPSGKRKLSEFYITYGVKWRYLFMLLIAAIIIGIIPYTYLMVESMTAFQYYQGAQLFIVAGIIARLTEPFLKMPDAILVGARHITANNVFIIGQTLLNGFLTYLFVVVWRIQDAWGLFGLVLLLGFSGWIPWVIKTIIAYIYIERYILHVKIYWMNSLILPIIASLPQIFIARWWYGFGFIPMVNAIGIEFSLAICVILLFIVIIITYFPIIALLGGFDDYQMFVFKKAVNLSGPSKPIFRFVEKLMNVSILASKKIGLHGRFPIPFEEAHHEIAELMEIKRFAMEAHHQTK